MTRKETAKNRLEGYIKDLEELLKEQKRDYPSLVQRAIRNEIDQLQKSIRHWEQVLMGEAL